MEVYRVRTGTLKLPLGSRSLILKTLNSSRHKLFEELIIWCCGGKGSSEEGVVRSFSFPKILYRNAWSCKNSKSQSFSIISVFKNVKLKYAFWQKSPLLLPFFGSNRAKEIRPTWLLSMCHICCLCEILKNFDTTTEFLLSMVRYYKKLLTYKMFKG